MGKNYLTAVVLLLSALTGASTQKHFCIDPYTGHPAEPNNAPALEVVVPEKPAGPVVVVCPGGAYAFRAYEHEGTRWADYFSKHGITTAVLGYRLPGGNHQLPAADVRAAMKYLRQHSAELGIDSTKIGVMGFSAGGHLASTVATHYDCDAARPAFQILFYPVISMEAAITHGGSRDNLIGNDASDELVRLYSNELQVKTGNPPAFIVLAEDDTAVPPANSLRYYQALADAHVPAELHVYPEGGHGFGYNPDYRYFPRLLEDLDGWIAATLLP